MVRMTVHRSFTPLTPAQRVERDAKRADLRARTKEKRGLLLGAATAPGAMMSIRFGPACGGGGGGLMPWTGIERPTL